MSGARDVFVGDVRVDGARIVGLGASLAAQPGDDIIDATDCAIIPGLVQAHVHLCQALFRGLADDLPLLAWLKDRIWPFEGAHNEASLRASAELGVAEMVAAGTTTILDMGTVHHHDVVFDVLERSGLRAFSGKAMMDQGEGVPASLRETTDASLRESARLADKWHGVADGRLRYAFAPRFILSCSDALLRGAVGLAAARPGTLLHSHAAEHADERAAVKKILGMDDVAALEAVGFAGPTAVLAHGVQLREEEMRHAAQLGTRFVHCPSANMKLASGIADVVSMRKAGLVVGLGADGAPCNNRMDPWTELRQAALLAKVVRKDAAALAAREAFELATIDGAKVLGLDAEVGSLEVGKRADVTVVRLDALHMTPDADVMTQLVYAATASDVRDVLVDGRVLYRDGMHQTLSAPEVRDNARREARSLMGRLGA